MNLLKSTGTFGFYTIISRLLGYLRDILIAIFLGTGMFADAFFVAFRIPNTFRRLFAEGTFNAAFVPSYSSEIITYFFCYFVTLSTGCWLNSLQEGTFNLDDFTLVLHAKAKDIFNIKHIDYPLTIS